MEENDSRDLVQDSAASLVLALQENHKYQHLTAHRFWDSEIGRCKTALLGFHFSFWIGPGF